MKIRQLYYTISYFLLVAPYLYAQQNYKSENFGDKSMLLNGNVTGSVTDLGATYYNPARLTTIKDPLFSINGKIYQLNTIKLENYVDGVDDLKDSDFISLPRMVSGTFKSKYLPKGYFAYSLLTRQRSEASTTYIVDLQEDDVIASQPGDETFTGKISIGSKIREEWYGVSWAIELSSKWSIGISLYASQYNASARSTHSFASIDDTDTNVAVYDNLLSISQKSYGLFSKIGVSYALPKIDLGINIDFPYIEVLGEGTFQQREVLTGLDDYNDRFSFNYFGELDAKRSYPLGIQMGAGIAIKKSTLHLNVSWNAPKKRYDKLKIPVLESHTGSLPRIYFKEELKGVVNFGAGAEIAIAKKIDGYLSYTTDFSPYIKNANVFDLFNQQSEDINSPTDFHHFGLGINLSVRNLDLALGSIYSTGKTSFESPVDFPSALLEEPRENLELKYSRWRFIVGLNISIEKELKEIKEKNKEKKKRRNKRKKKKEESKKGDNKEEENKEEQEKED